MRVLDEEVLSRRADTTLDGSRFRSVIPEVLNRLESWEKRSESLTGPTITGTATVSGTEDQSTEPAWLALTAESARAWSELLALVQAAEEPEIENTTRATRSTSTTVTSVRALLRARQQDERVSRLSPERRAMYKRIRRIRDEIGPVGFNVAEEIRKLREE